MFKQIIKRIQKHLEGRRKWNRMKRFLRDRAESRLVVGLYSSGCVTKRV